MVSTARKEPGWYIVKHVEPNARWQCAYFDGSHVFTTAKLQTIFLPKYFDFHSKIEMPKE